jgi:hypothetical protein
MVSIAPVQERPSAPRPARPRLRVLLAVGLAAQLPLGCSSDHSSGPAATGPAIQRPQRHDALSREEFNQRAAAHFLPLYWRDDADHDGAIEPRELAVLWGFPESDVSRWIDQSGDFSNHFEEAYASLLRSEEPIADAAERRRRDAVRAELAQAAPTLVETDLRNDSAADRGMVRHLMRTAELIEKLYARQKGVFELDARIAPDDLASRAMFHRNQSPFCEAPRTQNDPDCTAVVPRPPHVVGLYPREIQKESGFCDRLAHAPNGAELMDHFSVVVAGKTPGTFAPLAYSAAYREDMSALASTLELAAQGYGKEEPALTTYLRAAARAFRNNDWPSADRAWVAMNADNSKWYVRVAPDEVYYDPCAWKAGFALQLARIDPASLEWQKRLDPFRNEMEQALAALAGPPYTARDVKFKLPDFIEMALNAGDQRAPMGATVGQSLPNWGEVPRRTVVMTNLYTDPDSRARLARTEASVFCAATNSKAGDTKRDSLIVSLLHEAAHNLGPGHEHRVNGADAVTAFGGPLASTLEEMKAQNSAMFLAYWLQPKGVFTADQTDSIERSAVSWAFGHISRGMYAPDGTPRNYSQLAAIQVGSFMSSGAIEWKAGEMAANGTDMGCIEIHFDKLSDAVRALEETVLRIKSQNDRQGAERLKVQYVDGNDDFARTKQVVTERWLRAPKASFVYSLLF